VVQFSGGAGQAGSLRNWISRLRRKIRCLPSKQRAAIAAKADKLPKEMKRSVLALLEALAVPQTA